MPLVAMAAEDAINPGTQIVAQFATPVEDDDDDDDDDAAVIAPVGTPAPVVKPVSPKTGESRTAAAAAATLFAAAMAAAYLAMKSRREEQA